VGAFLSYTIAGTTFLANGDFAGGHWLWDSIYLSFYLQSMTYTKKYETSGIRVVYSGDQRGFGVGAGSGYSSCTQHHFTFNEYPCAVPGPIEGIVNLNSITNVHRPSISKYPLT